jgi:tetratricopeptide (TPR) repeat protein
MPRRFDRMAGAIAIALLLWPGGSTARAQARVAPSASASRAAYAQLTAAYAALRNSQLDSAIVHFAAALELTPNRTDVRKELAYTFFRVGRNDLAREQFERVIALDTVDAMAALELAYLDYESPDASVRATAHAIFNRLRSSRDPSIRARATAAFGNVDGALAARLAVLEPGLAKDANSLYLLELRAQAALERNDTPLLIATYRQLLANAGAGDDVRLALARVLLSSGQVAEGESLLRLLVSSIDPEIGEEAHELLVRRAARGKP